MDHTYLILCGWSALYFGIDGDGAYFLHNPYRRQIINQKGVLNNETVNLTNSRVLGLRTVKFDEVPQFIIDMALTESKK